MDLPTRALLISVQSTDRERLEPLLWGDGCALSTADPRVLEATLTSERFDVAVLAAPGSPEVLAAFREHAPGTPVVLIEGGEPERAAEQIRALCPPVRQVELSGARVDLVERVAHRHDGDVHLTAIEVQVLRFFGANPDRVVPTEELLTKVWGYRPGVQSRAVASAVTRLRKKVEADPRKPRNLCSVYGVGYRFVPEAVVEARGRGNLPAPRDAFVGREEELAEIARTLGRARLLTLLGPGGAGKTRAAVEAARRLGASLAAGAWFADFTDARTVDDALAVVAGLLGVEAGPERVDRALADAGAMLLVVDNCEHAVDVLAELCGRWLDRAADLRILATSREPLRIAGEHRLPLEPLGLPEADDLVTARASDAVALFVTRGRAVDPAFELTTANVADVTALVRALDGLPLSVELAAARLATMAPERLRAQVELRFDVLFSRQRDRGPRHRTLRAVLDWSWDLLDEGEQAGLARLSIFEGGWTAEAAAGVVQPEQHIDDLLASLAEKSLIRVHGPHKRFGMLVSIQAYAADRLAASGDLAAVEVRHGAWFAGHLEMDWSFRSRAAQDRLRRDVANIAAAARRAVGRADAATAAACAVVHWNLVAGAGNVAAGAALLDEVPRDLPPELLLQLDYARGRALAARGAAAQAVEVLGGALELSRSLAAPRRTVKVLTELGMEAMKAGQLDAGAEHLKEAAGLAADLEWVEAEIPPLAFLAQWSLRQGRLDETDRALRSLLARAVALGDPQQEALLLAQRAQFERLCGRAAAAVPSLNRAVELFEEVGDAESLTIARAELAAAHGEAGRLAQAAATFQTAADTARRRGNEAGEALTLGSLGATRLALGQPVEAEAALRRAHDLSARLGRTLNQAINQENLGWLLCHRGEREEGERLIRQSLAVYRAGDFAGSLAHALARLADLALADGDGARALTLADEAVAVAGIASARAEALCARARARIAVADLDAARADLAELAAAPLGRRERAVVECVHAELALAVGHPATASRALEVAEAEAAAMGIGAASPLGHRLAWLRGRVGGSAAAALG